MLSLEQLLAKLVAIPSISGFEEQIAIFVARFCRDRGHEVWTVNGNVAVQIRGINSRHALLFNGHLDTVPADWPGALHMVVKETHLEGRGVTDMKSGLAIMCMMAQIYQFSPSPCDLWLLFSREEETTAQGSVDLANWWTRSFGGYYAKKAVLILEPTGNAYVAFCHKGGGVFKTTVTGCGTRHGSSLLVENTALDRVCTFGARLKQLQRTWLRRYKDVGFGVATINLTRINSYGEAPNVVPDAADVWVDIRTNGALTGPRLQREFAQFRSAFGVNFQMSGSKEADIVACRDPSQLRQAFARGWRDLPEGVFPAATDMNAFLWVGLPVGIIGPGNGSLHQKREYIGRGSMEYCLAGLTPVIRAFASS